MEDIKTILSDLYHKYPSSQENFVTMLNNYQQLDIWGNEIYLQVNQDGLNLKPITTPIDEWRAIDIRHKVFRIEQNVPYEEDEIEQEELESNTLA